MRYILIIQHININCRNCVSDHSIITQRYYGWVEVELLLQCVTEKQGWVGFILCKNYVTPKSAKFCTFCYLTEFDSPGLIYPKLVFANYICVCISFREFRGFLTNLRKIWPRKIRFIFLSTKINQFKVFLSL